MNVWFKSFIISVLYVFILVLSRFFDQEKLSALPVGIRHGSLPHEGETCEFQCYGRDSLLSRPGNSRDSLLLSRISGVGCGLFRFWIGRVFPKHGYSQSWPPEPASAPWPRRSPREPEPLEPGFSLSDRTTRPVRWPHFRLRVRIGLFSVAGPGCCWELHQTTRY